MMDAASNDRIDETAVLHAADAWQMEGFSVWDAVSQQIAAETSEPVPVRADTIGRALYETGTVDTSVSLSDSLVQAIAHLEATPSDAVRESRVRANQIPSIDLNHHVPGIDALAVLPAEVARENRALPMRKIGNKLWVAWEKIPPIAIVDAVRMTARCQVIPMLAQPPGAWEAAFAIAYPSIAEPAVSDPNAELLTLVRELKNEVALLRSEVEALKRQQSAAKPIPPRPVMPARLLLPTAPSLFPLGTPSDF